MDTTFDAVLADPARIAAAAHYLVGDRRDTVLILGTRGSVPCLVRLHEFDECFDDRWRERMRRDRSGSMVDGAYALIFTLDPARAGEIGGCLLDDPPIPVNFASRGQVIWSYADRYWGTISDDGMSWPPGMQPVKGAGPLLSRSWALRLAATVVAHGPQHTQYLPDFRHIGDGTHLALWEDHPYIGGGTRSKPLTDHESAALARSLMGTDEPGDLTAAAVDDLLAGVAQGESRFDLWVQAAQASSGSERANASALAALTAWRWNQHDRAQAQVREALAACPQLIFATDVAALVATGTRADQLIAWHGTGY